MGYVFAMGTCVCCGHLFSFNPVKVPSIRIDGERQPVCRTCIEHANPERIKNGMEPIIPDPEAYESCNENELD